MATKPKTTAQIVADMFDLDDASDDDRKWYTADGVGLAEVCEDHYGAWFDEGDDWHRFTFGDGSAITVRGESWAVEVQP